MRMLPRHFPKLRKALASYLGDSRFGLISLNKKNASKLINVNCFYFSNLDSKWIYTTKHEESQFRHKGRVSMYTHIDTDTHNLSLRVFEHIERAAVVITDDPKYINKVLQTLRDKQRTVPHTHTNKGAEGEEGGVVEREVREMSLMEFRDRVQKKTLQFDTEIEISKIIELEKEMKVTEKDNAKIVKSAKEVEHFMRVKEMEKEFKAFKDENGFPPVLELSETLPSLKTLRDEGFDIIFLFREGNNINSVGKVIRALESESIPYEILPSSGKIIEAIVSSGLPADRFSVEMFPEEPKALLARRKSMKITTCWEIKGRQFMGVLEAVEEIMSKEQIVYVHISKTEYFRGEIFDAIVYMKEKEIDEDKIYHLIIAPYIPEFNESLKNELNIKSHIQGELQSPHINLIEMEILVNKLEKMSMKEQKVQIDSYMMAAEMLAKIGNETVVKSCLTQILRNLNEQQIENIIQKSKEYLVIDHIGLNNSEEGSTFVRK